MNVKSDFLNDVIQEEVFVRQPSSFENLKYPYRVYKPSKVCTGLNNRREHGMLGLSLSC
jgi:hypothetical protein